MITKNECRRCRSCKKLFSPDRRCRFHQRFCADAACQRASKVESQRKWRMKAENLWHWRSEKIFGKIASQRPDDAGLEQPLPEREEKLPDDPVILGLLVVLCGSKRQVLIATYVSMAMRRRALAAGKQMPIVRRFARRHGLKIASECSDGGGSGKGGALP